MDPLAWSKAVEVVRDKLTEFDPEGEETYRANAVMYIGQINELHAYAERVLGSVPEPQRVLVTAHDAFNYFGRRYGYEVVGIQGISTESEAGVRDIERLVDLLVERNIGAVFVESTVSERNISALVSGAAARDHTVEIGGELFSDAMGREGTYEGTYLGMIDHNVTTIARALGGEAPAGGMNQRTRP
jgi:manganese/zinc/iron transport system substrate-binding protein